jgi:aspartyl-tRNA synthetase
MCGELRPEHTGAQVILLGWVNRRRDLGNVIFIDIRDRSGMTQLVFDKGVNPAVHEKASALRSEYVIAAIGKVRRRDADTINKNIATGEVEVTVDELKLLNESKLPPFLPSEAGPINEEVRLKYRYIDLRREKMQANIQLRHNVALAIRQDLAARGFLEIETPFMTRSTPEGARDYLVPSRVHPGEFYALPQSPQLFKQILMISGFDKYFQIVRCFRDEDLRADRQPEFTQIDLEMSFPQPDRVYEVVESFLKAAFKAAGIDLPTPFVRMSYDQAIRQYGIDKPDMRLPAMTDIRPAFSDEDLADLRIDGGLNMVGIRIPNVGKISDREKKELRALSEELARRNKDFVGVLYDFAQLEKKRPQVAAKIRELCGAGADDLLVPVVGIAAEGKTRSAANQKAQYTSGSEARLELARKYADKHKAFERTGEVARDFKLLWVTDFPMFEHDDKENRWNPAHHPFTSPHEQDMDKLQSDPGSVRALAYDVVLNGTELGSGSIRIHRQDIQKQIFTALGMTDEEARSRFGFFLDALEYGTPPHGGIALGLDRIVMILAGEDSLREVIPFPKTAKAIDMMVDAPSAIGIAQEDELEILAAWPGLSEREWRLSGFCDQLLKIIEREVFTKDLPWNEAFQTAMAIILTKGYNDSKGAVRLAKAGYGGQAAALCRSIVEGAINSDYLYGDTNLRSTAFLKSIGPDSYRILNQLKKTPNIEQVEEAFRKAGMLSDNAGWPKIVRQRLGDIPNADTYYLVFSTLSQMVHSGIGSVAGLAEGTPQQLKFLIGPSHESLEFSLVIVFDFFKQIAARAFEAFRLDTRELGELAGAFHRHLNS